MIGLGTIANTASVVIGGVFGILFRKSLSKKLCDSLTLTCGIAILFMGISGTIEKMFIIDNGVIKSEGMMLMIACLTLGTLIGELLNIEYYLENFGNWLMKKSGSTNDSTFIEGFLNATITICIGAMSIIGAIQDGLYGDPSTLYIKATLDMVVVMIMTCSYGKGCIFSAIPIFLTEGLMTLLASALKPIMTDLALHNLSLVGSVLVFAVGFNLISGSEKKISVCNILPAILLAVLAAFLPF